MLLFCDAVCPAFCTAFCGASVASCGFGLVCVFLCVHACLVARETNSGCVDEKAPVVLTVYDNLLRSIVTCEVSCHHITGYIYIGVAASSMIINTVL